MSHLTASKYFTDFRAWHPAAPLPATARRTDSGFEALSYAEKLAQGREMLRLGCERIEAWDDEMGLLRGKGKRFNLTASQTKRLHGIESERANLARLLHTLNAAMLQYSGSRSGDAA